MDWKVRFSKRAEKQFDKLDSQIRAQILLYFESRVVAEPDPRRLGKALSGELRGYWRYRIGDYRAICELRDHELVILVLVIGHRKEIYD
jgi:mRNA interferase RelE/StbE